MSTRPQTTLPQPRLQQSTTRTLRDEILLHIVVVLDHPKLQIVHLPESVYHRLGIVRRHENLLCLLIRVRHIGLRVGHNMYFRYQTQTFKFLRQWSSYWNSKLNPDGFRHNVFISLVKAVFHYRTPVKKCLALDEVVPLGGEVIFLLVQSLHQLSDRPGRSFRLVFFSQVPFVRNL